MDLKYAIEKLKKKYGKKWQDADADSEKEEFYLDMQNIIGILDILEKNRDEKQEKEERVWRELNVECTSQEMRMIHEYLTDQLKIHSTF
jgi:hypothetical protein